MIVSGNPASLLLPLAQYDSLLATNNNEGPSVLADRLAGLHPDVRARGRLRVLDVGAGTGLPGVELARRGFTNLEALGMGRVTKKLA